MKTFCSCWKHTHIQHTHTKKNKYAFFSKWTMLKNWSKIASWYWFLQRMANCCCCELLELVFRKLWEYLHDPIEVQLLLSSISWDLFFFFSVKSKLWEFLLYFLQVIIKYGFSVSFSFGVSRRKINYERFFWFSLLIPPTNTMFFCSKGTDMTTALVTTLSFQSDRNSVSTS